jgi:hypothetical protein
LAVSGALIIATLTSAAVAPASASVLAPAPVTTQLDGPRWHDTEEDFDYFSDCAARGIDIVLGGTADKWECRKREDKYRLYGWY